VDGRLAEHEPLVSVALASWPLLRRQSSTRARRVRPLFQLDAVARAEYGRFLPSAV